MGGVEVRDFRADALERIDDEHVRRRWRRVLHDVAVLGIVVELFERFRKVARIAAKAAAAFVGRIFAAARNRHLNQARRNRRQENREQAAEAAGADFVGDDDLVKKIQTENWFGFDVCVATPDMMGTIGRIARILGPKGLMPNPKSGTVTMDVTKAINDIKAGKVEYRVDKTSIVHVPVGKVSFGADKLQENLNTLMDAVIKAKPAAAKGTYIKSLVLSTTMGPGVKFNSMKF